MTSAVEQIPNVSANDCISIVANALSGQKESNTPLIDCCNWMYTGSENPIARIVSSNTFKKRFKEEEIKKQANSFVYCEGNKLEMYATC